MPKKQTFSRLAFTASLVCFCILTTVALVKHTSPARTDPKTVDNSTDPVQNIRFTVYDVGIYPQEMTLDAGRVGIAIDDRTGKSAGLSLQRLNGNNSEPVGQVDMAANRHRSRGYVKLTPGRYKLFDKSNPQIFSTLIVNP
jgi:hypothetical protein